MDVDGDGGGAIDPEDIEDGVLLNAQTEYDSETLLLMYLALSLGTRCKAPTQSWHWGRQVCTCLERVKQVKRVCRGIC